MLLMNLPGPVEICAGTTATLSVPFIPGVQYQWYYESTPLNGATASNFTTPAPGSYSVEATTGCGTFRSDPVQVIVRSIANISISNNVIICLGEKAQLSASGGVSYAWTPEEGLNEVNIANPTASPKQSVEYIVTITDDYGCRATASVTVTVMCDTLDIPSGFSPNNDGVNDHFIVEGIEAYGDNSLFIYNRWGNLIFETTDKDINWDGKNQFSKGECPDGVYYYTCIVNFYRLNGIESKKLNGYIHLIRGK